MIDKFAILISHLLIIWSIIQLLKYEKKQSSKGNDAKKKLKQHLLREKKL
ncbi:MAG: hypothetical protein ACI9O6_000700 [Glaciecola sp.]|jgi:hypothetical protein